MRQKFDVLHLFVKWKKLMKKQTGMKIKVLQFDHAWECKVRFLQYGQNNGISIHFTVEKQIRVAKELNGVLLDKVRYLLSNALSDKSFWSEPLLYASHLINK